MAQPVCDLNSIRDDLIGWAKSLWHENAGAFRNGNGSDAHLPGSLFIAYILYAVDGLNDTGIDIARWTAWIRAQQNEKDGSFAFPPPIGSSIPRKGIALWNAKRVLGILGGDLDRFPEYQREACTIDGLRDWFRGWAALGDSHHEILALAPIAISHPDDAWRDTFFEELDDQQHPHLGFWPKGDKPPNISRTFAYTLLHLGMNRVPSNPEGIIDTILSLQSGDGLWQGGTGFSTMDAIYLLSRLPRRTGHREPDAKAALSKTADRVIPIFHDLDAQDRSDTHRFTAPVLALALLSQALPDRFTSSQVWRFAWEDPTFWKSGTIEKELRA